VYKYQQSIWCAYVLHQNDVIHVYTPMYYGTYKHVIDRWVTCAHVAQKGERAVIGKQRQWERLQNKKWAEEEAGARGGQGQK